MLTDKQRKANARNQLFRQIHGYNIEKFLRDAAKENAITSIERITIERIIRNLQFLKDNQFYGSKEVGLNPRRRCAYCKNIARWKLTICGHVRYCCNKCKEEAERNNEQDITGEWMVTDIYPINPKE